MADSIESGSCGTPTKRVASPASPRREDGAVVNDTEVEDDYSAKHRRAET